MHTATTLPDGRVLVLGGQTSGEGVPLGISRSAEIWDPATNKFRMVSSTMNTPRAGHTATLMGDGRVLIVGGFSTGGGYNFAEVFNPATETFSIVASPENRERGLHAAALLPDGSLLVMGGETAQAEPLAGVYRFRPDLSSERVADMLFARTLSPAVVARDGTVFLFGGEIWPGNVTTEKSEAYTPLRGGFPIAGLPQPRIGHTATRLLDGRILIAGGETAAGQLIPTALLYE
jgi:N-acetylneuraminic acid mutarotase